MFRFLISQPYDKLEQSKCLLGRKSIMQIVDTPTLQPLQIVTQPT